MNADFEWMRIAVAMALMGTAFIGLPVYFLWHDKRVEERQTALREQAAADRLAGPARSADLYNSAQHDRHEPDAVPLPQPLPEDPLR